MSDGLYSGLRFRTFNVLDDFSREALAIEIDTSLPSRRLVRLFEQLKAERTLRDILRTDKSPEFLGDAFTDWCRYNGVLLDYIEPGKLNQNAYIQRFNRSYRQEVLDTWLFRDLEEAREISWAWMLEYNEERDHDSLGDSHPARSYIKPKVLLLQCLVDREGYGGACAANQRLPWAFSQPYQMRDADFGGSADQPEILALER